MMYLILDEEETRLYAIIRGTLERIDYILQEQKSLQVQKKKFGQVFQMIIEMSQDLEKEENMFGQAKSSIEKLDRRITKA